MKNQRMNEKIKDGIAKNLVNHISKQAYYLVNDRRKKNPMTCPDCGKDRELTFAKGFDTNEYKYVCKCGRIDREYKNN